MQRIGIRTLVTALLVAGLFAWATPGLVAPPESPGLEREYLARNEAAMATMHAGMEIKPRGDVDADFAAMMIPHHQGAIDMAVLELRYGKNEQLRRIAQEIIVDQQQEITAMRRALGLPLPASTPAPTEPGMVPEEPRSQAPAPPHHTSMDTSQ
jgi:hypothetical protein